MVPTLPSSFEPFIENLFSMLGNLQNSKPELEYDADRSNY